MDKNTAYVLSLSDNKCDPELGAEVEAHLRKLGWLPGMDRHGMLMEGARYDPETAVSHLTNGIKLGMANLGLDMANDPSLKDTPKRFAKMLVGELTKGLNFNFFPKCTDFPNGEDEVGKVNEMVFLGNIQTISLCEHHLQTIYGDTHIAYLPDTKMIGLSKLARVTDFFARRPQVQERMTEQIYHALSYVLKTEDVAVVQSCAHYCMRARGSLQHSSVMKTNKMGGRFLSNPALRQEFLDACHSL
jgi:GTP cyclohydrolase I